MPLSIEERSEEKELFLAELKNLYYYMTFESSRTDEIDKQFTKVLAILSHFEIETLPYSAASKFIYEINDDDVEYFFDFFEKTLSDRMKDVPNELVFQKAIKLLEHLELANSQKAYLFNKQEQKLTEISNSLKDLNAVLIQYNKSKSEIESKLKDFEIVSKQISSLSKEMEKFKGVEEKFDRIEKSTEQITTNLITILGIFASILLGAYGSISGFSSIFANANELGIGKILMLSSVGASAILLILFFLLSSIARLTGRQFGNGGTGFIDRHPIIFFGHCILLIIFTTGGVIELIKKEITIEKNWLWILLIIIVVVHVLFIYRTKSMWGILKYFQKNTKEAFKKAIVFMIFVIMFIIILAYHFEYINY